MRRLTIAFGLLFTSGCVNCQIAFGMHRTSCSLTNAANVVENVDIDCGNISRVYGGPGIHHRHGAAKDHEVAACEEACANVYASH